MQQTAETLPVDVCIISPLHPSSNPRLVKDADALSEAGYRVSVIAADYSTWGREADKEFLNRRWKIIERPKFGPLLPGGARAVELVRRASARFATNHLGVDRLSVVFAAWHPVAPALVAAAKRQPARLYLAHLVAALPAAALAAAHQGTIYAFDAEDFHPGDLAQTKQNASMNRLVRLIEEKYLPGCAYITAASPGISDAYAREYSIPRPQVVLNAFPLDRAPAQPSAQGNVTPGPSIYWFSQTIGAGRGLECAVQAIALSQAQPHLYLRGSLAVDFSNKLAELAAAAGVSEHVHILPPESPSQMERLAAEFDVGLSGEPGGTPNNRIALGNKLFSYLLAGIPILLSDTPGHQTFVGDLQTAAKLFPIDDPLRLARVMDEWLLDPRALADARRSAWQLAQTKFNWGVESKKLVAEVARVLGAPSVQPANLVAQS